MKFFIFNLLVILLFVGCKTEQEGQIKYDFKTIKVSFSTTEDLAMVDSIIDVIDYIKLEDTKERIGLIKKIIIENNKIIIWDDARKCVWIFTDKGKFVSQVSRFGNGIEEYASIYNISFTEPNIINIVDGISRTVNTYTTNGKFIVKETTEGNVINFLTYQNKTFWFYYFRNNEKNTYYFNVEESDNSRIGFFQYNKPFLFLDGGDFLIESNDLLYLRLPYNDTIFSYENKTLTAKYIFDFGINSYPSKEIYDAKTLREFNNIISQKKYEGNISNLFISKEYMVLSYNQQQSVNELNTSVLIRNLVTDQTFTYRYLGGLKNEIIPNYPMATDGENFYSLYNSTELPGPLKNIYKNQNLKYDVSSNPILIKYKYKL